tara:strand:- start:4737 stop:5198 length:462 start_codon:yes stop_codon:yes gene_type:complete
MKILLILLTTLLTAAVSPTGDPLADLYLRQFLGAKVVPMRISNGSFYRQVEFNTKFISSVVGPENMVSGNVTTSEKKKTVVSYSVHANPRKLKEKLTTITHFTRKTYPMGYKIHKLQWLGENDFKIHMSTKNKKMILYFKYNKKHKLFNVWMR